MEAAVAQHDDFIGETLLERLQRVERAVFLEEVEAGIDQQHHGNNDEVFPLLHRGGKDGRRLDHPRDRPPEAAEDAMPERLFLFRDFVVAETRQPVGDFRRAQTVLRLHLEPRQRFRHRQVGVVVRFSHVIHVCSPPEDVAPTFPLRGAGERITKAICCLIEP